MQNKTHKNAVAVIRENACVGCTKCIVACPFDAIIGATQQMHTVLSNECTGCGLCISPCPMDCIEMVPVTELVFDREKAKQRVLARKKRAVSKSNNKIAKNYLESVLARNINNS